MRTRHAIRGIVLPAMLCVTLAGAAGDGRPAAATAKRFADAFWAGDDETVSSMCTPTMQSAMTAESSKTLRERLVGANGELTEVGAAWREDRVAGFERFRVPLVFDRATLDLRVVLDSAGRVAGMFVVAHAEAPDDDTTAPVRELEVQIGDDATGLPGTLSLPEGDGPFPGVVLVHGSGPNDRDESLGPNRPFRDLAWGLAGRGVAVLRYDKRSYARPGTLASAGAALTVKEEVIDDARAALALLRRRDEVDDERVFVLGHSLGGTVAPRIAAAAPPPAGVIVLAGASLPLPEKMLEQVRYIAAADGSTSDEEARRIEPIAAAVRSIRAALDGDGPALEGFQLGAPIGYYRDLEQHDPTAIAAASKLPYLVLQGGRDYQVTLEDFARWRTALAQKKNACLVVYDSLDHLFRPGEGPSTPADYERATPVAATVIDDVAAWIAGARCPGTQPADPAP